MSLEIITHLQYLMIAHLTDGRNFAHLYVVDPSDDVKLDHQTLEEGQRAHQPKPCDNNKDEDVSPNVNNNFSS